MNMHKITTIVAFSVFLTLGLNSSGAYAQEESGASEEVTEDSTEDTVRATIDWPELDLTLAPLEEVELPPAQLSNGSRGERQTYLQRGEVAPWPGVLLNPSAVAYLIAEAEAARSRAEAALQRQRESDWNRLRLEVGQLRLRVTSDRRQADVIIAGLEREVERRIQIHESYVEERNGGFWNTDFGEILQWGLVVVGAAAVGFVVGYLAASLD